MMMTVSLSEVYSQTNTKPSAAVLNIESKGVLPDAESAGIGFFRMSIAATACGVGVRSYSKPGATDP